ncbi:MAG: response regulator transcription factor [Chloroflexi bacterium]|nr:MAG: response regulator transcription factor [Chloroflexota bacterium]
MSVHLGPVDQPSASEMTCFANNIGRIRVNNNDRVTSSGPYPNVRCTRAFMCGRFSRPTIFGSVSIAFQSASRLPVITQIGARGSYFSIRSLGGLRAMATTSERIRVVVADDHPSTRENLRYLLNAEPDLEVVGAAQNGVEALRLILELRPDVAVLDREMPLLDGLRVAARLQREQPRVRVVLFTLDRVFVVEDNDTTRQALVDFLSDEGFLVESALDGREALGVASSGAIDVIVLDLWLRVLDGAAFADIWRKHPRSERVPIIAMSGLPQSDAIAAGVGAAAFRDKPLDLPSFANLLRATAIRSDPEPDA